MPSDPLAQPDADPTPREVAARFHAAWAQPRDAEDATPELLPVRLARACTVVLPVDGAGLSLMSGDFRVPLGASDDQASFAEQLQFTQGEGPCLDAAQDQRIQVADDTELSRRWPTFHRELVTRTPYRAVLAVPLAVDDTTRGALDLFFTDAGGLRAVSLADAGTVSERVVETLSLARAITGTEAPRWSDQAAPAWLHSPSVHDRELVWIAMGMLMTHDGLSAPDALAALRAYAYGHDTVLDAVAADLTNGDLAIEQLSS